MYNQRKVIICDFDGTIINQDLEKTFLRYILSQKEIKWKLLILSLVTLPINICRNFFHYPSLYKSWTFTLKGDTMKYIDRFILECNSKLTLRKDVLKLIDSLNADEIVLLTGCYEDLAISFLKSRNLYGKFNKIIGSRVKTNNFKVERHPFGKSKREFVDKNNYNIGIADSKSDKYYLNICNEKYYV